MAERTKTNPLVSALLITHIILLVALFIIIAVKIITGDVESSQPTPTPTQPSQTKALTHER